MKDLRNIAWKKIAKYNAVWFNFFIVWKQAKLINICWGFAVAAFSKEPCLLVLTPLCNPLPHCYQSCVTDSKWQRWWSVTSKTRLYLCLSVCLSSVSLITHCAGSRLPSCEQPYAVAPVWWEYENSQQSSENPTPV